MDSSDSPAASSHAVIPSHTASSSSNESFEILTLNKVPEIISTISTIFLKTTVLTATKSAQEIMKLRAIMCDKTFEKLKFNDDEQKKIEKYFEDFSPYFRSLAANAIDMKFLLAKIVHKRITSNESAATVELLTEPHWCAMNEKVNMATESTTTMLNNGYKMHQLIKGKIDELPECIRQRDQNYFSNVSGSLNVFGYLGNACLKAKNLMLQTSFASVAAQTLFCMISSSEGSINKTAALTEGLTTILSDIKKSLENLKKISLSSDSLQDAAQCRAANHFWFELQELLEQIRIGRELTVQRENFKFRLSAPEPRFAGKYFATDSLDDVIIDNYNPSTPFESADYKTILCQIAESNKQTVDELVARINAEAMKNVEMNQ